MSSAARLFEVLRADMKAKGLTYRELAQRIGMSESSVKRMFGEQDMPLSRLTQVSEAVGTPFEDLLARAARSTPELAQLTLEQERALVADPRLLLVAICCLSQWSVEQMLATYALTPAEAVAALADPANQVYFDATLTGQRPVGVRKAITARKHIYCEKPGDDLDRGSRALP